MLTKLLTMFGLLALLALPIQHPALIQAQEATEDAADCTAQAQAWHDQLDPDGVVQASVHTITDSRFGMKERMAAFQTLQVHHTAAEALDFPPCVGRARAWYLDALTHIETAATWVLNHTGAFLLTDRDMLSAYGLLGEFRGYLAALDVTIIEFDNDPLYFD